MKLECMECGAVVIYSNATDAECPECGSTDLDLAWE